MVGSEFELFRTGFLTIAIMPKKRTSRKDEGLEEVECKTSLERQDKDRTQDPQY